MKFIYTSKLIKTFMFNIFLKKLSKYLQLIIQLIYYLCFHCYVFKSYFGMEFLKMIHLLDYLNSFCFLNLINDSKFNSNSMNFIYPSVIASLRHYLLTLLVIEFLIDYNLISIFIM
jgi:hypothetical protein